jgi:hypothetical protein
MTDIERSNDDETLPPYQKDEFPPRYRNAIEQPPEFVQEPIPAVVNSSESDPNVLHDADAINQVVSNQIDLTRQESAPKSVPMNS